MTKKIIIFGILKLGKKSGSEHMTRLLDSRIRKKKIPSRTLTYVLIYPPTILGWEIVSHDERPRCAKLKFGWKLKSPPVFMEKMKICGIISQKKFPKGHPHYFHFPLKTGGF